MAIKNNFLNRRSFILGSSLAFTGVAKVFSKNTANKSHIVVLGGGWGGLSAAKTLRLMNKNCKITLIEKNKKFVSCPMSNWVIGQLINMKNITFDYKKFKKNNDIDIIFDQVTSINVEKKIISTSEITLKYDKLILSPGIKLDFSDIDGFSGSPNNSIFSAWKAGNETQNFSNEIRNIENGDNIIISIPLSPYRCPPGPYERTSLIADYIKKNKINAKVIVLDANQKIVSKGLLFKKAWNELYKNIIFYYSDSQIRAIAYKENKVFTDFEEYHYKTLNIIPPQKAPSLLFKAGLIEKGRNWAPVNPYDFTSKYYKDIYIIGDSTDASSVGSVPKSGYVAYSMGKVAGLASFYHLLEKEPPAPSMINTCYSLVSQTEGISVSAVYKFNKKKNKIVTVANASGLSPKRSNLIALNAWDWALAIWKDMLT